MLENDLNTKTRNKHEQCHSLEPAWVGYHSNSAFLNTISNNRSTKWQVTVVNTVTLCCFQWSSSSKYNYTPVCHFHFFFYPGWLGHSFFINSYFYTKVSHCVNNKTLLFVDLHLTVQRLIYLTFSGVFGSELIQRKTQVMVCAGSKHLIPTWLWECYLLKDRC